MPGGVGQAGDLSQEMVGIASHGRDLAMIQWGVILVCGQLLCERLCSA